jgi:hypothetical protein
MPHPPEQPVHISAQRLPHCCEGQAAAGVLLVQQDHGIPGVTVHLAINRHAQSVVLSACLQVQTQITQPGRRPGPM